MGARVAGPGCGVASGGVDQALGRGAHRRLPPSSPEAPGQVVEVGQGGVSLGVHDPVHVLGPADHTQLGHRLVGRDHQLQPRALGVHQPLPGGGVTGPARAVEGGVLLVGHRALQAQQPGAGAAPQQRRLAPGGVVGQGLARVVVAPGQHGGSVVLDRIGSHDPHPGHRSTASSLQGEPLKSCPSDVAVWEPCCGVVKSLSTDRLSRYGAVRPGCHLGVMVNEGSLRSVGGHEMGSSESM